MSKITASLGCLLVLTCTLATAQKRGASRPATQPALTSGCGSQATTKGKAAPQTCNAGQPASESSIATAPANASMIGRIANKKLGKTMPRPGTPDFLPASNNVSGSQLP